MATDKPRFTISLEPETFAQVLNFKDTNGIATQSGAIQRLVERGIQDLINTNNLTEVKKAPSVSDEAMRIAAAFDKASDKDKNTVRQVLDEYMSTPTAKESAARLA